MNRIFCGVILLLVAYVTPVQAFSVSNIGGKDVKWTATNLDYWLDVDGFPGISGDSDRQVCIQSFQEWDAISCSYLTLTYAGDTNVYNVVPTGAQPNGKCEIIWKDGNWPFGEYVLGVTSPLYGYDGVIIEADVAFSGVLNWVTSGANYWNTMDVKSVAIHEFGHMYGVQHNLDFDDWDPPTMAPYVNQDGKSASLADDDTRAMCYLYPAQAYTCTGDSQCPYVVGLDSNDEEYYSAKYKCQGGKCVWGTVYTLSGQKDLGGACSEQWQCKAPMFCLPTSNEFCTRWCNEANPDCPAGFVCSSIDSGPDGLCFKMAATGSVAMGGACWASVECKAGLYCQEWFTGGYCAQSCNDVAGGTGCSAGYTCAASESSPTGGGCYAGSTSKAENGESCSSNTDCKSGLCFVNPVGTGSRCRQACNPLSPACAADQRCVPTLSDPSGTTGACVPLTVLPQIPNGITCARNWECQSNLCFLDPEDATWTCRQSCTPSSSNCPSGSLCVKNADGFGGCVPGPNAPLGFGSSCVHGYDCQSGYCVKLPGAQKKYCRDTCSTEQACPAGTRCVYYDSPDMGYCMPNGKEAGELCFGANECTTYICWSPTGPARCREPCTGGTCPVGNVCNPLTQYGPACTPVDGTGGYDVGVGCDQDDQCKSKICLAKRCAQACDLTTPDCPAGYGCVPLSDGTAGGCTAPGTVELNQPCTSDLECATLLCVETSTLGRICLNPCTQETPCPQGQECASMPELGGLGVCLDSEVVGEDVSLPTQDIASQPDTTQPETPTEVKNGGTCSASPASPEHGSAAAMAVLFGLLSVLLLRRRVNVS